MTSSAWKVLELPPPTGPAPRCLAVANQKGGVGKTTTAINLGAALAQRGHRALVVDLDPQANATTGLGLDPRAGAPSSYDLLLGGAALVEIARPTAFERLECVPSAPDLAGAEVELVAEPRRERRLGDALGGAHDYGVVLVDCPPSLGLLTLNALAAVDDLVVPVQCEYYALEGLGQLLDTATRVRAALGAGLRVSGFVLTMYDARTKLSAQVAEEVRRHFGELVFAAVIPRSVRLSESPSFGEPVVTLDPGARGAIAYKVLAAEVEARYRLGEPARAGELALPPGAPGGRGYGTSAPEPPGLEEAWPRVAPWGAAR
jgi:chromosome partitioning protein